MHNFYKHGNSSHPLFNTWRFMLRRCLNTSFERYAEWGGRGITVCERWQGDKGFQNFLEDMGDKPSKSHTLDRKNNDLWYSKENCRWATKKEQSRNRRIPVKTLTYNGETRTLVDFAHLHGLSEQCLNARLKLGWSVEKSLKTKVGTFINQYG